MKAIVVGERTALNQRLAHLLERNNFQVTDATPEDDVVALLAENPYDLMLLVAMGDDTFALDLVSACKDVRPALHVYVIAETGELTQVVPRLQPVLGRRIGVNDLPGMLREEIARSDVDREHFRSEWLRYAEDVMREVGEASTVREAAQKVVAFLEAVLELDAAAIALDIEPNKPPSVVAKSGDNTGPATKILDRETETYQWITENETALLIRRGRSPMAGIQREIVKFSLGPCAFVPIMASGRFAGVLVCSRDPGMDPLQDSAFHLMRIAANAMTLRLGTDLSVATDDLQHMLQQEREYRQSLENTVSESGEVPRRLAREVATLAEMRQGQRMAQGETIARLSVVVIEQLNLPVPESLQEAIYLRDIGLLSMPDLAMAGSQTASTFPSETKSELARTSFEVLSRVRMPSNVLEVARHHYENYDGTGVPEGLAGEQIPALARVVRVVEDYVNMTVSGDGGEGPVPSPVALGSITRDAGRLYDPNVADTFVRIVRAEGVSPEQETLSLIAHELRTPLTFLAGFSELLAARGDLSGQAKEMASELQKQTEQMVTLTERLLELSRLQSGRMSLTWSWIDLNQLIQDQITKAGELSSAHRVRTEGNTIPIRIRADATRAAQALSNLITNAIKYSPAGGEVVVRVSGESGRRDRQRFGPGCGDRTGQTGAPVRALLPGPGRSDTKRRGSRARTCAHPHDRRSARRQDLGRERAGAGQRLQRVHPQTGLWH